MKRVLSLGLVLLSLGSAAVAQVPAPERIPSHCRSLAQTDGVTYLWQASVRDEVAENDVRLHYIDHSMFVIQAGGLSAVTDFNGYLGPTDWRPDVVTMNHAHSSHFTGQVDPSIPYVLRGWGPFGLGVEHNLDLGAMLIRNVSTDIRSFGSVEENGNSIFIFETGGLCIGHLGHLHHEPNEEQYAAIGRLDVVLAPVDGGLTVPRDTMMSILRRVRSSIIIPMHWFGRPALEIFLSEMQPDFEVVDVGGPELTVSLHHLPERPTIMVLSPAFVQ